MKNILNALKIDETYTKPIKRPKNFTKVKDVTLPVEHFNYMADVLFLPKTSEGYKYCLTVVDLGNDEFDIEPMKDKEAETVLKSMQEIFKRDYIKKPKASIQTDSGTEFQSVFHKWLFNENILHRITLAGRHSQQSNVESLHKTLGRLFNGYMNTIEQQTGKQYNEWTEAVPTVRTMLNELRKKKTKDPYTIKMKPLYTLFIPNKYKVGDIVYRQLDIPKSALGHDQSTHKFRMGDFRYDLVPRKVLEVLHYDGAIKYRYIISGIPNVAFAEHQLIPAKETETQEKYVVKKIIDKRTVKKQVQYKVWWQGYLKKQSTWEPKNNLIEDGLQRYIDEYEESLK